MSFKAKEPKVFDAIIMAGDGDSSKPVYGDNKGLLELEGIPLFGYAVAALQQSRCISRIFIIGPEDRIKAGLDKAGDKIKGAKEIIVIPQLKTGYENAMKAFMATLPAETPDGKPMTEEEAQRLYSDKTVLYLGADLPLLTSFEVEEFIEKCDIDEYDYLLGTTSLEDLAPYAPKPGSPGIRLAPFCFKNSKERQNNLHLIRLLRVANRHYPQLMYEHRYQKKWKNIIRLLWTLLCLPEVTIGVVVRFLLLHVCRLMDDMPLLRPVQLIFRKFLDKAILEKDLCHLLKTRFCTIVSSYGGAALDVDDEESFRVIRHQFNRWEAFQEALYQDKIQQSRVNSAANHVKSKPL